MKFLSLLDSGKNVENENENENENEKEVKTKILLRNLDLFYSLFHSNVSNIL